MHCELIVPGLLPAGAEAMAALEAFAAEGDRLPALELLLARGRRTSDEATSLEKWLACAFDLDDEAEVPAGALTAAVLGEAGGKGEWLRADPAHLRLNRDQLVLVPAGAFALNSEEARALADHLNGHFGGELEFHPLMPDRWWVRVNAPLDTAGLRTETAAAVAGKDINRHLPTGEGCKRWHALLNEIQMVLHEHPVNEAREARGEPPVNSVWLWGAGPLPRAAAATFQSVTSDDPLAQGLAQAAHIRYRTLPDDAGAWLAALPEDGRQLLVLDGLRLPLALGDWQAWRARLAAYEAGWFAPLLAALKAGRIGMVTVTVPDGDESRSFETTRNDQRHFWRRPRALATLL